MQIKTKRVYEKYDPDDGKRILIDRLWPRGQSRQSARIDVWIKEVAPSNELRKWYGHEPDKWPEFRARYFAELDANPAAVEELIANLTDVTTFLFSSKEESLNNATALKEYILSRKKS